MKTLVLLLLLNTMVGAQTTVKLAIEALRAKQADTAIALSNRLIESDPRDPGFYFIKVLALDLALDAAKGEIVDLKGQVKSSTTAPEFLKITSAIAKNKKLIDALQEEQNIAAEASSMALHLSLTSPDPQPDRTAEKMRPSSLSIDLEEKEEIRTKGDHSEVQAQQKKPESTHVPRGKK
jgi:hypothetical protein